MKFSIEFKDSDLDLEATWTNFSARAKKSLWWTGQTRPRTELCGDEPGISHGATLRVR